MKTLKGLAYRTHFDHARLIMKPKETDDSMLILRRDTEHHSQLGFQLNIVSLDLLRIKIFYSLTQVVTLIRVFLNCIKKKKGGGINRTWLL